MSKIDQYFRTNLGVARCVAETPMQLQVQPLSGDDALWITHEQAGEAIELPEPEPEAQPSVLDVLDEVMRMLAIVRESLAAEIPEEKDA